MQLRIQEMPQGQRPREKLSERGASALDEAELLALFIRTGTAGRSAIDLGRELLDEFGSLNGIARADITSLTTVSGIGPAKAIQVAAAIELGRRLALERVEGAAIDTPEAAYALLAPSMRGLTKESLQVILLNTQHRLIRTAEISLGSLNESIAHPREILKPAIVHSAYGYILAHNHPSGDPTPSAADRQLTRRLAEASEQLQIHLFDHIIVGQEGVTKTPYFSFRESGLL